MANRYDDAIKAWCAADLAGLCRWLGVPVMDGPRALRLAESVPAATTRAVDLLVATDRRTVVHVEFQTRPEAGFARRMLGYWLRLDRLPELAGRTIVQHAVLLGPGRLEAGIDLPRLRFSYTVHRLADEDPERFLVDATLAPLAPLGRVADGDRPAVLARALALVAEVADEARREVLARVTLDLAAIRLDTATIKATWEESAMPVPSFLNQLYEEGFEEGLERAAASLLVVRFGDDPRARKVAARLARLGATDCMRRIETAASLDELI